MDVMNKFIPDEFVMAYLCGPGPPSTKQFAEQRETLVLNYELHDISCLIDGK
jgi:hypothetical protein